MTEFYVGLMSGTSMDGVDAVLVDLAPHPLKVVASHSVAIPHKLRSLLLSLSQDCAIRLSDLAIADHSMGQLFAQATTATCEKAGVKASLIKAIGSHGQTIFHYPQEPHRSSLQIGDPNIIAELTGITTIADFRRRDMAAGGQGAPLVPAFHQAAFRSTLANRVVLNIGGIANITVLPKNADAPVTGFDTGPGNILMDAWISKHLSLPMDDRGTWAARGQILPLLLDLCLQDPYFQRQPPKSTGRELFNLAWIQTALESFASPANPEDVQATLCELTAISISQAILHYATAAQEILICGGGAYNNFLVRRISHHLPQQKILTTSACGIDPKHVEAIAFAWLAKQTLMGQCGNLPAVTGATHPVILGGIYKH